MLSEILQSRSVWAWRSFYHIGDRREVAASSNIHGFQLIDTPAGSITERLGGHFPKNPLVWLGIPWTLRTLVSRKFVHVFLVCPPPHLSSGTNRHKFRRKNRCRNWFWVWQDGACSHRRGARCEKYLARKARCTHSMFWASGRTHELVRPLFTRESLNCRPLETTTDCSVSWLVRATENITAPPRCRQVATGKLQMEKGESPPSLVCVETAIIYIQCVLPSRVPTRVETVTPISSKGTSESG